MFGNMLLLSSVLNFGLCADTITVFFFWIFFLC